MSIRNVSRRVKKCEDSLVDVNESWSLVFDAFIAVVEKQMLEEGVQKADMNVPKGIFDNLVTQYDTRLADVPESDRPRLVSLLQVCSELAKTSEKEDETNKIEELMVDCFLHLLKGTIHPGIQLAAGTERVAPDYVLKKAIQFARNPGQPKVFDLFSGAKLILIRIESRSGASQFHPSDSRMRLIRSK